MSLPCIVVSWFKQVLTHSLSAPIDALRIDDVIFVYVELTFPYPSFIHSFSAILLGSLEHRSNPETEPEEDVVINYLLMKYCWQTPNLSATAIV